MRSAVLSICSILVTACSDEGSPAARTDRAAPQMAATLPTLEHDFGIVPHAESPQHEFVVDPSPLGANFVPLRVVLDCSCARADLRVRRRDGSERVVDGSPLAENVVRLDDKLIVRVILDTVTKESVDLPPSASGGRIILQRVDDPAGRMRASWPILLRYGIDAPVVVEPFAALDFGNIPASGLAQVSTTIRGDERHPQLQFTGAVSSDPAVEVTLEPLPDRVRLVAKCRPGDIGHHRVLVSVTTDDPSGYKVNFATTWKVVPDLEARPMAKIGFRADLSRAQRDDEAKGQFVVVADHDVRRPAEFTVHELVDADSRDAAAAFAVTLSPVPGQPREHRLHVRYVGGRTESFRGRLVLTKHGADGPFLPIELVVFPTRDS